jgi:hypothetical protein
MLREEITIRTRIRILKMIARLRRVELIYLKRPLTGCKATHLYRSESIGKHLKCTDSYS